MVPAPGHASPIEQPVVLLPNATTAGTLDISLKIVRRRRRTSTVGTMESATSRLSKFVYVILKIWTLQNVDKSIYNNRTGFDLASDRPYLVQPARSTPFPLTRLSRLPSGALRSAGELRWGDGWVGTECWYHAPYGLTTAAAARITAVCSNLLPHINYSSSRQGRATRCDAATCGLCRHR